MILASTVPPGEPLRDLFARAIDQTKVYFQAEVAVVKRTALSWANVAKYGLVFGVVAIFLLQAALTTLFVAIGFALAPLIGTAGGLAVSALLGLLLAGLFGWLAARRFAAGAR